MNLGHSTGQFGSDRYLYSLNPAIDQQNAGAA